MKNKYLKPALALALVAAMAVGGTLAYIIDTETAIENKFVYDFEGGNTGEGEDPTDTILNVTLDETFELNGVTAENDSVAFEIGDQVTKQPTVTVDTLTLENGAWVFVKISEVETMTTLGYVVDTATWTPLDGVAGVYYRSVTAADKADVAVFTADSATKNMTEAMAIACDEEVTLTIEAGAIQKANLATAAEAWAGLTELSE